MTDMSVSSEARFCLVRISGHDLQKLPVLKREDINRKSVPSQQGQILIPLPCGITLGDFYHLGQSGCQYTTWLQAD